MISNERHWPSTYPSQRNAYPHGERSNLMPPRPFTPENSLEMRRIQIERKSFLVMLKENSRGRFLRITEDLGARSNSIIVPAEGFADFLKLLGEMTAAAAEIPSINHAAPSAVAPPPVLP